MTVSEIALLLRILKSGKELSLNINDEIWGIRCSEGDTFIRWSSSGWLDSGKRQYSEEIISEDDLEDWLLPYDYTELIAGVTTYTTL